MNTSGKLDWFPLNASDFMNDKNVKAMDANARGVYISMLCVAWGMNGGFPNDPDEVARFIGLNKRDVRKVWPMVRLCWVENEAGDLINLRLERERAAALERSARNKRAALVRWADQSGKPTSSDGVANA